jgi:hypothetical protein
MQAEAEALRTSDPDRAKGIELLIREGERQMTAFETGERYTPSPEMMSHAQDMFSDWKEGMLAQGAPPEYVARAEFEFTQWSSGEPLGALGPGHEFGGPAGQMPSVEQMQAMGMTAEQIQAATVQQQYIEMGSSGHMPTLEQMQTMGMTAEQIQMAQQYEANSNFGINPSTGGWEPNMGGSTYTGGWEGTTSGGTYTGETWTQTSEGTWASSTGETWTHTGTETWTSSNSTELRQDMQTSTTTAAQERYETAIHKHGDTDHQHTIHVHSDSVRHDHTATSPADTAPNSVFQ